LNTASLPIPVPGKPFSEEMQATALTVKSLQEGRTPPNGVLFSVTRKCTKNFKDYVKANNLM
jgi:hypothetical protein